MAGLAKIMRMNLSKFMNFILFQGIWFACILGAAHDEMLSALILFATMIYWQSCPKNRNLKDLVFLACLLPIGFLIDSLWVYLGLIEYNHALPFRSIAPYWIAILWVAFALSLNSSMQWLFKYPKIAVLFGAVGGPLSYLAAERLGAISIPDYNTLIPLLALAWALLLFLILIIDQRLQSNSSNNRQEQSLKDA